jgi:hypothetical protein
MHVFAPCVQVELRLEPDAVAAAAGGLSPNGQLVYQH